MAGLCSIAALTPCSPDCPPSPGVTPIRGIALERHHSRTLIASRNVGACRSDFQEH